MSYAGLYEELEKLVSEKQFTVTFIKKDKSKRTMTCTLTDWTVNSCLGYMTVLETNVGPKTVNLNTLISLTFEGKIYTINKENWTWQVSQ